MAALSATFSSSCHDPTGRFREAGLNRSPVSLPQKETYIKPFSDDLRPLETLTYVASNFLALGAQCLSHTAARPIDFEYGLRPSVGPSVRVCVCSPFLQLRRIGREP